MKLQNILSADNFCFFEDRASKKDAIEKLAKKLWKQTGLSAEGIPLKEIVKELQLREKEQSTGIGEGFAFPHARLNNLSDSYFLIAVSKKGIDFEALDDQPVHFIILTVVPRLQPGVLLSFRAAIAAVLMNPEKRKAFLEAKKPEELFAVLGPQDEKINDEIIARHIMKPVLHQLRPEMTLFEAARELHKHHVDSLPVIDGGGKLLGKLSCHDLFSYKLPEFFNTLHSISFIRHMNPFEKYFEADQTATVGSLKFKQSIPAIAADATLMEMVFMMTVKNKEQLYVTEGDRLIGTIDRHSIIDKVLITNFNGAPQ